MYGTTCRKVNFQFHWNSGCTHICVHSCIAVRNPEFHMTIDIDAVYNFHWKKKVIKNEIQTLQLLAMYSYIHALFGELFFF